MNASKLTRCHPLGALTDWVSENSGVNPMVKPPVAAPLVLTLQAAGAHIRQQGRAEQS
jgi:hypothetical protein